MIKIFFLAGMLSTISVAHAQDLPSLSSGNVPDATSIPGIPSAPQESVQRIGGTPEGMVLSTPVDSYPVDAGGQTNSGVSSAIDFTAVGAIRNGQGGGLGPSSASSSSWGFRPSGRQASSSAFQTSSAAYAVTPPGAPEPFPLYGYNPAPATMYSGNRLQSGQQLNHIVVQDAGAAWVQPSYLASDIPDLRMPSNSMAEGLPPAGYNFPDSTAATESSRPALAFPYQQYSATALSRSLPSRGRRPVRRGFTTFRERQSTRSRRMTFRERSASRLRTGQRDR